MLRTPTRFNIWVLGLIALYLLAAGSPAAARITSNQLPRLQGDTFAGELRQDDETGATRDVAAMWNLQNEQVHLYLYEPATGELEILYSAAATVEGSDPLWTVHIEDAGLTFDIERQSDGTVLFDSEVTRLVHLDGAESEALALPTITVSCLRCLPFIWDCCQCCFCVHRALGIPKILDVLCCLFQCIDTLPWLNQEAAL